MNEFISSLNWVDISVIVLVLISLGIAWFFGERQKVAKIIYTLVLQAENIYDQRYTGERKYQFVTKEIMKYIPKVLKPFITESYIEQNIETAVVIMKKFLKGQAQIPPENKSINQLKQ